MGASAGPVATATQAELDALPEHLRHIPEARLCLTLAYNVDMQRADLPSVSREYRAALAALREAVARAGKRGDSVDEIEARRAARRAEAANPRRAAKRK